MRIAAAARRRTAAAAVKLALFAVVTLSLTAVLASTIGTFSFGSAAHYQAVFTDVTGLQVGDSVRIAGVRVGRVDQIRLLSSGTAEIGLALTPARPLPRSTQAAIRWRNLVGQRYVALSQGPGSDSPLPPGGVIPLSQTTPALDLTVLFDGFRPLFAALSPQDVNRLADEIIRTLQGEGGSITTLLAHTASLTSTLANRDAVIGATIGNLNAVLGTVDARDQALSTLIVEMERFVSGLAGDRQAIGASLDSISALATSTAGLLAAGRPSLAADIGQLGTLSSTLANHKTLLDQWLRRLPNKLTTITRTASYGSWFNFYLCDVSGQVVLPTGTVATPTYTNTTARCAP
ncbi:MAG: MCE family protein [Actinomycetes bacterium]